MARFQHGAVIGVDLLDMAVAFDEEQVVDFFDLDAAADEAKDDLLLCRWRIVSMTRSMAWSNCFCVNGLVR